MRDGFFPLGSGLFRVDLEPVHLDQGRGTPGAQIHTAITDDIEHGGALSHPHRMVILAWQAGRPRGQCESAWCAGRWPRRGLPGPSSGKIPARSGAPPSRSTAKPTSSASSTWAIDLLVALLLDAVIVGFGYLNFIHEAEFHGRCVLPRPRVGRQREVVPSPLSAVAPCA